MIPVNQKYKHDPDAGVIGDCFRACLASLLELPLEQVPHFALESRKAGLESMMPLVKDWLAARGLYLFNFPVSPPLGYRDPTGEIVRRYGKCNPNIYYILAGAIRPDVEETGEDRYNHAVICHGGRIVHNPNDSKPDIVGPINSGSYLIFVLTRCGTDSDPVGNLDK